MNQDLKELFTRGVATFIDPDGEFQKNVKAKANGKYKKDIVIKLGVDPTRPDIHLGHAVVLKKLRQFQDVGCKVIFLIGDFTGQIGDPTGRSKVRPELSLAEIQTNMKTFLDQVGKILLTDEKIFSWITNSEWYTSVMDVTSGSNTKLEIDGKKLDPNSILGKAVIFENTRIQKNNLKLPSVQNVSLGRFISILRRVTHSRLIARDMFKERLEKGEELYMHEMMYPVLQGTDSAVLAQIYGSCDLEIGGTDQTFNMLVGRDVMKVSGLPEQAVMALDILPGLDGKEKMSKSLNNYIAIVDTPSDMFGKIMSLPDELIPTYFKLAAYTPEKDIEKIEKELKSGKTNPRDAKFRLAHEIVAIYHGDKSAVEAERGFVETFSNKSMPKDALVVKVTKGSKIYKILISNKIVSSKTEWHRLVSDKAVTNMETGEKLTNPELELESDLDLRVGKHRFIKLEII